jgi:hypothetical protein
MHRTLKAETAHPPQASLRAQQRAFLQFQVEYNQERPHEALGQIPPAQVYQPSARPAPERVPVLAYADADAVRRVRRTGELYWRKHYIYLSAALVGESVGLTAVAEGQWQVAFGPLVLGTLDERQGRLLVPRPGPRPQPDRDASMA